MQDKIDSFVNRLSSIGIKVELAANYPWIYLDTVQGKKVQEKFEGNHGFTVGFLQINDKFRFTDTSVIFKTIRKYI